MKRILVIGCPGAGKSTFARALRDRTALPLWYLDQIWHRPDRTTVRREEFDPGFRQWIESFGLEQLPVIRQLLERYQTGREVHIFYSRAEAANWLQNNLLE